MRHPVPLLTILFSLFLPFSPALAETLYIGSVNGNGAEFNQNGASYTAFNFDTMIPAQFPKELNNSWWTTQEVLFNSSSTEFAELTFTVAMSSGTLNVQVEYYNGSSWVPHGVWELTSPRAITVDLYGAAIRTGQNRVRLRVTSGGTWIIWDAVRLMRNTVAYDWVSRRAQTMTPEDLGGLEFLRQVQDVSSPQRQLVPAMEDTNASTFNNAVVAMAFILKNDRARAERILDFYANAALNPNNSDRTLQAFYYQGQARGFYQSVTLAGANQYHNDGNVNRWLGDNAWLALAVKYYENYYASTRYNDLKTKLQSLFNAWFVDLGNGQGYVSSGWEHGDSSFNSSGHREGNIDVYAVFNLLGDSTRAGKVKAWLNAQLGESKSAALDEYGWRYLMAVESPFRLNYREYDSMLCKTVNRNGTDVIGFLLTAHDDNNIWLEGSAQMACAYFAAGFPARARYYANQMDYFLIPRTINGVSCKGIPHTANTSAGYGWVDVNRGFASTVAWYIFAKNQFNPLRF